MLVPGRAWCSAFSSLGSVPAFGLLGPLGRGQYVERISFSVWSEGTARVTFGAVMGLTASATVESWGTGRPLVDRSTLVGDGQPVIMARLTESSVVRVPLFVGVRVTSGPAYLVWRVHRLVGLTALHAFATVRVLEELAEGAANGAV